MTAQLSGGEMASKISDRFPEAVIGSTDQAVLIKSQKLIEVMTFLKNSPETSLDYLTDLTAVDYLDYFELVYRLTSLSLNHSLVIKVRCEDRENAEVASVTSLWKGADFMEREIFDLFGIRFAGHPNMTRIFLWEGFSGHPLRKDYVN